MRLMLVGWLSVAAAGCAPAATFDYPARYAHALAAREAADAEQPGGPPVIPADASARFAHFFETLPEAGIAQRVEALYADELYFSDTLFVTEDLRALVAHFERLQRSGATVSVSVDDSVAAGANLYVRWRMRFDFRVAGRPRTSETIGMSQLRFDKSGRICFQQDFWDSTQGFYRHIPGLGSAIGAVAARMAAD